MKYEYTILNPIYGASVQSSKKTASSLDKLWMAQILLSKESSRHVFAEQINHKNHCLAVIGKQQLALVQTTTPTFQGLFDNL